MLLLSLVSINLIQNLGIIEKVKLAKEEHRASTIQEQKELFEKEIEISKYEGNTPKTINDLLNKLEEQKLISEEEKNTIMQTGRITIGSKKIIFDTIILPEGYTRCEYLESTGTQYIDTGIVGKSNHIYFFEINLTENDNNIKGIFGARNKSNYGNCIALWLLREYIRADFGIEIYAKNVLNDYSGYHKYKFNKNIVQVDENNYEFQYHDFNTKGNILLFTCNNDMVADSRKIKAKWKNYKRFNENNEIIQDFIPCLDNNNKPCMYDTVTGQTFYNQGTGEFIAGPIFE